MDRNRSWMPALAALLGAPVLAVAACGPMPADPQQPDSHATAEPPAGATPSATAVTSAVPTATPVVSTAPEPSASSAPHGPLRECRLPEPKKSADACKADSDCAPSEPCHAHACVARAKANPPTPTTMCTRMMDCSSVDANRCACFEGVCALVPPPPRG
jgi:hypothetical protein